MENTQFGGMKLNDDTEGTFKDILGNHIVSYFDVFFEPLKQISTTEQLKKKLKQRIELMTTDKYTNIIRILIRNYFNTTTYEQQFQDAHGNIIATTKGMKPYHTNMVALIFLSFLLELEMFALTHHIISYNTESNPGRNTVPKLFQLTEREQKYRVYRDIVNNSPNEIVNIFTRKIDKIFYKFMDFLVQSIAETFAMTKEDVCEKIVPNEHIEHVIGTYDFIYVDWKERLSGGDRKKIIDINNLIKWALRKIEEDDTEYIADGVGFFSFIFLLNGNYKKEYYGSCITYTMFEIYVMSLLHVNGENINLLLENQKYGEQHEYWNHTQNWIGHGLSHWATSYDLTGGYITMRSLYPDTGTSCNFDKQKHKMLRALIWPIFDSAYHYIRPFKSDINLMDFIEKRLMVITTETLKYADEVEAYFIKEKQENIIEHHEQQKSPPNILQITDEIVVPNHKYYACDMQVLSKRITTTAELYEHIEELTRDWVDTLVKASIKPTNPVQQYVLLGGKAINYIVDKNYLKPSFDFDIHLYNKSEADIAKFGLDVINEMNNFLNGTTTKVFRFFLYQLLLHNELITESQRGHYMENNLFYFGRRVKPNGIEIKGLFFHLKLRPDLQKNCEHQSLSNRPNDVSMSDDTKAYDLFYPISDIDLEEELNFGNPISKDDCVLESYGGLKYAKYVYCVFNLMKYVLYGGVKQEKNFNKLELMLDPTKHACSFTLNSGTQSLNLLADLKGLDIKNLVGTPKDGIPITHFVGAMNIFNEQKRMADVIAHIIFTIRQGRETGNPTPTEMCRANIVLDSTYPNKNVFMKDKIFNDVDKFNDTLRKLETYVYDNDNNRYLLTFTSAAYSVINAYQQYKYFNYDTAKLQYHEYDVSCSGVLTQENRNPIDIKVQVDENNINAICEGINTTIRNIRKDPQYNILCDNLKDEFDVYRVTTYFSYAKGNPQLFNPSIMSRNSIIYMPHFQSTTYATNNSYASFLRECSMLLKIRVGKTSPNWVFLGEYSNYQGEKEILLNSNVYYMVDSFKYIPVRIRDGNLLDIPMVSITLYDSLQAVMDALAIRLGPAPKLNGGGEKQINCINMTPQMIAKIEQILMEKNVSVNNFGDLYDVPMTNSETLSTGNEYENLLKKYCEHIANIENGKMSTELSDSEKATIVQGLPTIYELLLRQQTTRRKERPQWKQYEKRETPILKEIGVYSGGENNEIYRKKYLKYKQKYIELKKTKKYT